MNVISLKKGVIPKRACTNFKMHDLLPSNTAFSIPLCKNYAN